MLALINIQMILLNLIVDWKIGVQYMSQRLQSHHQTFIKMVILMLQVANITLLVVRVTTSKGWYASNVIVRGI